MLISLVLLTLAVLALRTQAAWEGACTLLRQQLPSLIGLEVGINRCEIDPLTQTVTLRGLSIFPPGSDRPIFVADSAQLALRSLQLASASLRRVELERPRVYLDLTQAPKGAGGGCFLDGLKRVEVDTLEIRGAQVKVLLPGGQSVEVRELDLGWTVRRGVAELELDARGGEVRLGQTEMVLSRLYAEGGLDVEEEVLELTKGEARLDEASLELSGRVDSLCDPRLSLDGQLFVPVSMLARAAGSAQKTAGHLWSRVTLSGKVEAPVVQLDLAGSGVSVGIYSPDDFTAHLAYSGDELTLMDSSFPTGPGAVRAKGSLRLSGNLPLKLKVEGDNAQFGRILEKAGLPGAWVDCPVTGRAALAGAILPSFGLFGDGEARTGRFIVTSHPFDAPSEPGDELFSFAQGHAAAHLAVLADRVELTQIKASSGATSAEAAATLYFDHKRGLEIAGRSEAIDLSDFGHIAGRSWAGRGAAEFQLSGPYFDIAIDARASLRDFQFKDYSLGVVQGRVAYRARKLSFPSITGQKGKTQYFGSALLEFPQEGMRLSLSAKAPDGRAEDLLDAIVRLHPLLEVLHGELSGEAQGTFSLEGPASRFGGGVVVELRDNTYFGRRLGDGRIDLRFVDGEALVLDRAVLEGPMGRASAEGSWAFAGPLDYRFRYDDISLAELLGPKLAESLGALGTLALAGSVEGDSTTPVVSGYLTSPRLTLGGKPIGSAHLEGRIQGRELQLFGRPFDDARVSLKMRLREPLPFETTLSLALPEIRPLLPEGAISQGLSGSLNGTIIASGVLRDLKAARASAYLSQLSLSRGDFAGSNDRPISIAYEGGRLQVDSFGFRGPNTQLTAQGHLGPERIDFGLHGTLDMRLFESFFPQLERTAGKIEVTASATGKVNDPSLVGRVEVHEARFSLRDHPASVRALSGRVEFSESRVLVKDVMGILNDGELRVRGEAALSELKLGQVELGVDLLDVSYRPVEYLPLTASGNLLLYGRPEKLQLSGGVEVSKLRYEQRVELESFLKDVKSARVSAQGPNAPKEWLRFDVDVHAGRDVRIDNNIAKARLSGKLKLTGTNVRPGLLGTIEAAEGSQGFFRDNQLEISKGELQFKDASEIEPILDLHAQTRIREYLVTLKAFGRLAEPKVILSSEPSLPEADILALMMLGVTSRDRLVSSQTGAGLAAEAYLAASGMNRQVQRFMPRNPLLKDVQVHLSTTLNQASGQVEPALSLQTKLFTERLNLSVTQPVSGRGTRFQAEYQFDDRLSTRLQWDNESQDYSFGNPGLDLKLRFEWE